MKNVWIVFCCMVFLISAGLSFAAGKDDAVIAKETSMWEYIKAGDFKGFASNLSDNVVNIEPDGRVMNAKAAMMESISKVKMESYSLSDSKVVWLDEKTALVTYKATAKGTSGPHPINGDFQCASIWVQEGSNWVGRFHQETPILPMTAEH